MVRGAEEGRGTTSPMCPCLSLMTTHAQDLDWLEWALRTAAPAPRWLPVCFSGTDCSRTKSPRVLDGEFGVRHTPLWIVTRNRHYRSRLWARGPVAGPLAWCGHWQHSQCGQHNQCGPLTKLCRTGWVLQQALAPSFNALGTGAHKAQDGTPATNPPLTPEYPHGPAPAKDKRTGSPGSRTHTHLACLCA